MFLTWNLFVLFYRGKPFYFKIFQHNANADLCPAFAHFGEDEKTPFDVIYYLYKMKKRSKELCLVEENHATVNPDSSVAPREMKTAKTAKTAKAELNCEIYKS